MSEKEGPEKVSYGKAVVKIYPVKASGKVKGGFMLRWKDALGAWRSTKVTKGGVVEARKRAKVRAKAVELASWRAGERWKCRLRKGDCWRS